MTGRIAALSLVLALGCDYSWGTSSSGGYGYADTDYYGGTTTSPDPYYGEDVVELSLVEPRMAGTLGDIRDFDETPYEVSAVRSGGDDIIRFDGTDSRTGQWIMAQVDIQGGIDQETLQPGAVVDVDSTRYEGPSLYASGLGCAGPAPGTYTFDEPSSQMHIEVTSGALPGQRHFDVTLRFGGSAVDLSFDVAPTPSPDARVSAATLEGSLDGIAVSGAATFLSELHSGTHSTVLIERTETDGAVVRLRLDVEGGLGRLGSGTYGASDGIHLAASTTAYEVDGSYPLEPSDLTATVSDGAMQLVATFPSGETLRADLFYR